MSPKEAAAKVREMAESCRQRALCGPPDSARDAAHEREVAYRLAAGVIDQIPTPPVPQPWPPPEGVNHVLAWPAATTNKRRWIDLEKHPESKWYVDATVFSLWLPMPPAPEVQG